MNAAATFLTFGHLRSATTVNALPKMPTIIIRIVRTAARLSNGRPNLKVKTYTISLRFHFLISISGEIIILSFEYRNAMEMNTFLMAVHASQLCVTLWPGVETAAAAAPLHIAMHIHHNKPRPLSNPPRGRKHWKWAPIQIECFISKEAHKVKDTYIFRLSINESPEIMKLTKTDKGSEKPKHLTLWARATSCRDCMRKLRRLHIHTHSRRPPRNRNSLDKWVIKPFNDTRDAVHSTYEQWTRISCEWKLFLNERKKHKTNGKETSHTVATHWILINCSLTHLLAQLYLA